MIKYCLNLLLAVLMLPLVGLAAEQEGGVDKPNVVLIMVDQLTADGMSCVGNKNVATPSIDRIARRGVIFENSYVTQPQCVPCRTSFFTGMYPHQVGVVRHKENLAIEPDFLASLVAEAGYNTAQYGNWNVPVKVLEAGFDEGFASSDDNKVTASSVEYIKNASADKPYFLVASYTNPHNACQFARGEALPNGPIPSVPSDIDELPELPDNFAIPDNEPSRIREVQKIAPKFYPTQGWSERKWREYLWAYYRIVENVDAQLGKVLDAIEKNADRQTIVVFVSDHGDGSAHHHWNQKQILYDQVTKVPTMIASFGAQQGEQGAQIAQGRRSSALVSMCLDIPMTIVDIVGAQASPKYMGESLWGVAQNPRQKVARDYVFVETVFAESSVNDYGLSGRMVRSRRFKYCVYDNGRNREQLFDMHKDAGEQHNLVGNPRYADELDRMRKVLAEWQVETNDTIWKVY